MKKIISNIFEIWNSSNTKLMDKITSEGFAGIRHRDEYVGAPWVTPAGSSAPDLVSVTIAGVACSIYAFDGGITEEVLCSHFEIPHDMAIAELAAGETDVEGNPIVLEMHAHYMPSTTATGTIRFAVDYCYLPPQGAPVVGETLAFTKTISSNSQHYHFIDSFKTAGLSLNIPAPVGGWEIGGIIRFRLYRDPTLDTYPDDVLFIKAALHVPTNGRGSRQRFVI